MVWVWNSHGAHFGSCRTRRPSPALTWLPVTPHRRLLFLDRTNKPIFCQTSAHWRARNMALEHTRRADAALSTENETWALILADRRVHCAPELYPTVATEYNSGDDDFMSKRFSSLRGLQPGQPDRLFCFARKRTSCLQSCLQAEHQGFMTGSLILSVGGGVSQDGALECHSV